MLLQVGWLLALAAGMAAWTMRDTYEYREFRMAEDSTTRRRFYLRWTGQSFVLFVGASLVSLWLVDALAAPFTMPTAFEPVHIWLNPPREPSGDAMLGMMVGMAISITLVGFVQYRRVKKLLTPVLGDVEPLIPRNGREMLVAVPLSLNAGFSEELFFRCALPLLLLDVTGSLALSLAGSIVAFGLIHAYQGVKGVAATTVMGAVLTMLYLSSGSLLRVMVLHALIDLVALIVRPAISRWIASRHGASQPA